MTISLGNVSVASVLKQFSHTSLSLGPSQCMTIDKSILTSTCKQTPFVQIEKNIHHSARDPGKKEGKGLEIERLGF